MKLKAYFLKRAGNKPLKLSLLFYIFKSREDLNFDCIIIWMERKYHTLYIPLPEPQDNKLYFLFKHLNHLYPNTFLNEYSWMAHITLISLELNDYDTNLFIDLCKKSLDDVSTIDISFDGFGISQSGKFVILNLSEVSIKKLSHIKSKIDANMAALIRDNIPAKYTTSWESLSDRQKHLAVTTGSKYDYIPHVSIIKLKPENAKKALKSTLRCNIKNIDGFKAQELNVSKETSNFNNPFINLATIKLNY